MTTVSLDAAAITVSTGATLSEMEISDGITTGAGTET
jgi:hypothetical protein